MKQKEDVSELVDFLRDPQQISKIRLAKYQRHPDGGPQEPVKPYWRKAIAACEAKVPFFTISGSDFVEMLFCGCAPALTGCTDSLSKPKKFSTLYYIIDEIDAVGRKRGAGLRWLVTMNVTTQTKC